VPTPLLICADDFGYAPAVDEGIAALVERGRITATSCLTMSPRWSEAAALARSLRDRADVGLHLDLTEFSRHASLPRLLVAGRLGLLSSDALRERLIAQLSRFEDALGAPPDYVDGHQHVHQLPAVARILVDELTRRYGHALPWVRISLPQARDLKSRIIASTGADALRRMLEAANVRHTARLLGIYDFSTEPAWIDRATTWLRDVRAGDALMVHPATRATSADPLAEARVREFEALGSARFGGLLASHELRAARGDSLAFPVAA
jgi:predicted glycoside hydrolase/deacetylase ChbG (UPF0249 family)